jgi:hypothetical protein
MAAIIIIHKTFLDNFFKNRFVYNLKIVILHEKEMSMKKPKQPFRKKINAFLHWNRTSYWMFSGFISLLALIVYVWWPLVEEYIATYNPDYPWWVQFDWLLLGNFLVMSLLIMANANLRRDLPIALIGLAGGMVIESWGTQTELWTYYTSERPPLWIIPAWPIASLSFDRLFALLKQWLHEIPNKYYTILYWIIFPFFFTLLLFFVYPTINKSLTAMALFMCAFLILTPQGKNREMVLTFLAGAGLGYFLELWGTTRLCWTYYTLDTPPFFAVLAHGMAAVSFWRVKELWLLFAPIFFTTESASTEITNAH